MLRTRNSTHLQPNYCLLSFSLKITLLIIKLYLRCFVEALQQRYNTNLLLNHANYLDDIWIKEICTIWMFYNFVYWERMEIFLKEMGTSKVTILSVACTTSMPRIVHNFYSIMLLRDTLIASTNLISDSIIVEFCHYEKGNKQGTQTEWRVGRKCELSLQK
jgi:hypothetical protein